MYVLPTEACEDMSQFCRVDESVALLVKDLQTLDEVLHTPLLLLPAHRVVDREKLLETNSLSACPGKNLERNGIVRIIQF